MNGAPINVEILIFEIEADVKGGGGEKAIFFAFFKKGCQ